MKNTKDGKSIVVIILVLVIVATLVTTLVLVLGGVKVGTINSDSENNNTNDIKAGNVELSMTSTNVIKKYPGETIYNKYYEYFIVKNSDGESIVVDGKGKQVVPISGKPCTGGYKYIGDDYFLYGTDNESGETVTILVKNGKLVATLDAYPNITFGKCLYKNDVLYAGSSSEDITIAYDIKNKKELWRANGTFVEGYVLDDEFIRLQTAKNPSGDLSGFLLDPIPNTIVDYNGNKIVSGGDIEPIEWLGSKKYETKIYTSKANSYLEVKDNEHIKVYDLKNELKATITLKETDAVEYDFRKLLYSGVFIVEECQKSPYKCTDVLYNENGKELLRSDSITLKSYANHTLDEYILPKNLDLISTLNREELKRSYILIKDGEVLSEYKSCNDPKHNYGLEHHYLLYYEPDAEKPLTGGGMTYNVINLKNMKVINAPIEYTSHTDISNQAPNGEYVVLTTGNEYYVYDSEFNLKYESEYFIKPVNEKYVLSSNKYDRKENEPMVTRLINIETGEVTNLDVKGEYYDNNSQGLVTYDGTNYYLYGFK